MAYGFKNLIFEGGGVKGIAYVGAMEELEQRGVLNGITRVGGTSAGAINAVTTALGYTNAEVRDILWDLDFNNFMDDSWGVVRDTSRLINEFGWYKGDFFRQWIGNLIAEKTGNPHSTFKELADHPDFRDLYVCVTNISTKFTEVFSPEHTPRVRVADAVRMSMSIPLFFAAVRNVRGDVLVDGGGAAQLSGQVVRPKQIHQRRRPTGIRPRNRLLPAGDRGRALTQRHQQRLCLQPSDPWFPSRFSARDRRLP